ncbi:hypothetical protein B488_11440 [Liberibacter crescens BT-1]|uniref:Uncharacterized protein n=1 Tax=Liberibacter crescens (strain BT-1) TaxID=1215343 RepID=L0EXP0_LIBCB|nr:hypothetical protein B488_11440 [Liberibacter crescens BT-1]AMC13106.1 signal peptide protein [Liberibacter crescens]
MGKPITLFFLCAFIIIVIGSLTAPSITKNNMTKCAPSYGVDPCKKHY